MSDRLPATAPSQLVNARYVSLATLRRDGREVRTPVWAASIGTVLFCYSNAHAGKVKRIRANGRARLAACDFRGQVEGAWLEVAAKITDEPAVCAAAFQALRQKYGWQMLLANMLARMSGKLRQRVVIECTFEVASEGPP